LAPTTSCHPSSTPNLTLKENYFHAWTATVDGEDAEVLQTENGLICVKLTPGKHLVKLQFGYTLPETVGRLISGATAIIVAYLLLPRRKIYTLLSRLQKTPPQKSSKEIQVSDREEQNNDGK